MRCVRRPTLSATFKGLLPSKTFKQLGDLHGSAYQSSSHMNTMAKAIAKKLYPPTQSISPTKGPTGTAVTFSGTCPAGSINVSINETLSINRVLGTITLKPDSSWSATVPLDDDTGHPGVKDPTSGLLIWPAINWRFQNTCSGESTFNYPVANISTTRGSALKLQAAPTIAGFNVTVTPAAVCPFAADYASISVYSVGSLQAYYAYPPVKSDRSWGSVTIAMPKPSPGRTTTYKVAADCENKVETVSFYYTPQDLILAG